LLTPRFLQVNFTIDCVFADIRNCRSIMG